MYSLSKKVKDDTKPDAEHRHLVEEMGKKKILRISYTDPACSPTTPAAFCTAICVSTQLMLPKTAEGDWLSKKVSSCSFYKFSTLSYGGVIPKASPPNPWKYPRF